MAADSGKLEAFVGKMAGDMGAAMSASLVLLGDRLGLYKAMAEAGPSTSADLAARADVNERNLREWLAAQAAVGLRRLRPGSGEILAHRPSRRWCSPTRTARPSWPAASSLIAAMFNDEPKVAEAFQTGRGLGWHEHDACLFRGTERFFRPGYNANLVSRPGSRRSTASRPG